MTKKKLDDAGLFWQMQYVKLEEEMRRRDEREAAASKRLDGLSKQLEAAQVRLREIEQAVVDHWLSTLRRRTYPKMKSEVRRGY